jgi:Spy/CpxP family protein refolding chaperone
MKKSIACFALSTCLGFAMYAAPQDQAPATPAPLAQSQGPRQFNPDRQVRAMAKRLNLTADQQQQILPILTDRNQQMQSIRNDNSLSPKDRHAKMAAVREDSQSKIKALLTPDQKAAYDQMLQQSREHRRGERSQGTSNS